MQSVEFFDDRDDADLLTLARGGDTHCADVLWIRVRPSVLAVARGIADNQHDAEDLASEAMTKVFSAIAGGNGPTDALLPYLYATVRNLHVSTLRRQARTGTPLELNEQRVLNLVAPQPDAIESELVTRAFKNLPQRWRYVLWACLIEGRPGHETAAELGIKPAAVHALKSRALEGLRQQYLSEHARLSEEQECAEVHRVLASIARGRPRRSTDLNQVWRHLRGCAHCAEGYREITAINNRIGALLGPAAVTLVGLLPQHASGTGAALGILRLPAAAGKSVAAAGVAGILAIAGTTLTLGDHHDTGAASRRAPAAASAAAASSTPAPSTATTPVKAPAAAGPARTPRCLPVSLDPDEHLAPVTDLDTLTVGKAVDALTPDVPASSVPAAPCVPPATVRTSVTAESDPAGVIGGLTPVDTARGLVPRDGRLPVPVPAPELPSLPAPSTGLLQP